MLTAMSIESQADLEGLRRAGRVVALTLAETRRAVEPGITTAELDAVAAGVLERHGARSAPQLVYGFPGAICISVGDEVVHGVPGARRLLAGDVVKLDVTLDVTAELDGYMADAAVTVVVPPVAPLAERLAAGAETALTHGIAAARAAGRSTPSGGPSAGRSSAPGFTVLRPLSGHGIGRTIHEPPTVPNYDEPRLRDRLTPGLVITIEPMISAGGEALSEDADGWTVRTRDGSLAAHAEHTVVVPRTGRQSCSLRSVAMPTPRSRRRPTGSNARTTDAARGARRGAGRDGARRRGSRAPCGCACRPATARIGVILPLSKPGDPVAGNNVLKTAQLWVDWVNGRGGVGRPARRAQGLRRQGRSASAARSASCARSRTITAPSSSPAGTRTSRRPRSSEAHQLATPMFVSYAWSAEITQAGYPEVVRIGPNNDMLANAFAPFMDKRSYRHVGDHRRGHGLRPGSRRGDPRRPPRCAGIDVRGPGLQARHARSPAHAQGRCSRGKPDALVIAAAVHAGAADARRSRRRAPLGYKGDIVLGWDYVDDAFWKATGKHGRRRHLAHLLGADAAPHRRPA